MRKIMPLLVLLCFLMPSALGQDEWKRAHSEYKAGRYNEALVLLEEAIASHPDWWFSIFLRGKCQFALGNYREALTSYNDAMTLEIPTEQIPVVKYDLARTQMAGKDYSSAIKTFTELVPLVPGARKFDLYYNRGQCELQIAKAAEESGAKEKQMSYYSKAIVSFSESEKYTAPDPRLGIEAVFQKAYSQFKIGNKSGTRTSLENCIQGFEQVLKKDQRHEDAHRFLIEVSFQLTDLASERDKIAAYDRTVGFIDRFLSIWPKNAKMVNRKGQALQGAKRYTEAVTVFKQYVQMQPNDGMGYFSLGSCQMAAKDYDAAIESYNKAIAKGANQNQNVYVFAAYSFTQQKNDCYRHDIPLYQKAVDILNKGIRSNPGNSAIKRDLDAKKGNLQILLDNQRTEDENRKRALENIGNLRNTIAVNEERLARNTEMHISQPTAELETAIQEGRTVIKESRLELERELKELQQLFDDAKRCGGAAATDLYPQMAQALKSN